MSRRFRYVIINLQLILIMIKHVYVYTRTQRQNYINYRRYRKRMRTVTRQKWAGWIWFYPAQAAVEVDPIMKGLVIFHDHEVSFCHADKELEQFLRDRWIFLQKSAGATVKIHSYSPTPTSQSVFLSLSHIIG